MTSGDSFLFEGVTSSEHRDAREAIANSTQSSANANAPRTPKHMESIAEVHKHEEEATSSDSDVMVRFQHVLDPSSY